MILGPEQHGMCANWRLGRDNNPGWFDIKGKQWMPGQFALATVFRLLWSIPTHPKDAIYNMLHAVTMGHVGSSGKTHLEQFAQILDGSLHITCRITDTSDRVHRNTVKIPGIIDQYLNRTMLLIYTSLPDTNYPLGLQTTNVLYDFESLDILQVIFHNLTLLSLQDLDFDRWPDHRVVCDHEQNNQPRNHVIIHSHCWQEHLFDARFELLHVWGSLGQRFDPLEKNHIRVFKSGLVPNKIGPATAWYNWNGKQCTGLFCET